MKNSKLKANIAMLVTIFLWASAFVGIKYLMADNLFSAGSLSFLRYLVASLSMLILFIPLKNKTKPNFKDLISFLILGFIGFFMYNVCINEGEKSISAGLANFIICQMPIIVAVLVIFFLDEKINKKSILGFAICIVGIIIILLSKKGGKSQILGIILVYISAFSGAIYTVFQKKLLKKFHPIEAISYFMWFGTLTLSIYFPESIIQIKQASNFDILVIIYLGIFPGAISYLLWGIVSKSLNAIVVSTSLYFMPIFSIIMGWIFLSELPNLFSILGGIICILGAIIVTVFAKK